MNKLNTLFLMFFLILFLIIAGELGYLLLFANKTQTTAQSMEICTPFQTKSLLNTAILEQLKVMNPGITSSIVQNEYTGTIVKLDTKGGKLPIDKKKYQNSTKDFIEYQVELIFQPRGDVETIDYYWSSAVLAKITLFQKQNQELEPIAFEDLLAGDSINLYESVDLMKKGCVSYDCVRDIKIVKN